MGIGRGVPHHQRHRPAHDAAGVVDFAYGQFHPGEQVPARLVPARPGQRHESPDPDVPVRLVPPRQSLLRHHAGHCIHPRRRRQPIMRSASLVRLAGLPLPPEVHRRTPRFDESFPDLSDVGVRLRRSRFGRQGLWQYPLSCHRSARSCPPRGRTRPVVICSWCCSCCSWRWVRRRVCPVRQPGAAGPRRRPIAPATTWTCAPTPTAAAGRGGSECPSATRRSGRCARCTCACGATARTGAAHPAHPVRPACPRPSSCRVCAAGRRTRSR